MSEDYDIREVLSILSPSSIAYAGIPGTSLIKLTPHDVAARLRNCSRHANLLARGKYANDELAYRSYYWAFAVQVSGLPMALKLSKRFPKSLTKLVNIAMQEFVSSGSDLCPWHRAEPAYTIVNDKIIPCSLCGGSGKIVWTDKRRAELMGVDEEVFRRDFVPLHTQMVGIISSHESEIIDALYEREHGDVDRRASKYMGDAERVADKQLDFDPPPRAA